MSNDETWDRPMTKEEFKRLHPSLQKKRIDTSLRRKVVIVQRWAAQGVPKGVKWRDFANSGVKFREWEDRKRKLWPWYDDVPDHPKGRNKDIIEKWHTARALLRVNKSANPRDEIAVLKEKVVSLEAQNIQLIAEKSALEKHLLRAEERLGIATSNNKKNEQGR